MTQETFHRLWEKNALLWLTSKVENNAVSDLCQFKENAETIVYKNYLVLKDYVKEKYFINEDKGEVVLNRYKRAAVMAYTIIKSDPINVNNSPIVDNMFLKQRFALFFSIATILIDYKKDIVKGKKVYKILRSIPQNDDSSGNDSFLISVYKDFLYAELYGNFDVLGTANMFGLLVEYVIGLNQKDLINPN